MDIFDKLKKDIEYNEKPEETKVSTMTICLNCNNCIFDCYNIGKYLKFDRTIIENIIFSDENSQTIGRIPIKKKKNKKKKKISKKNKKDNFYNQVTVIIKIIDTKTINIKLFQNGSIQMTGCDSMDNAKIAIQKLFGAINTTRYLYDYINKQITEIKFVNKNIVISDIINGTIALVNCNFNIGFEINRDMLYKIISNKNSDMILEIKKSNMANLADKDCPNKYMSCNYDPIRHACVNIKLNHPFSIITIFVFESGSIIILGKIKTFKQIKDAYNFINLYLLTNYFFITN